jgi:hypothetical protein
MNMTRTLSGKPVAKTETKRETPRTVEARNRDRREAALDAVSGIAKRMVYRGDPRGDEADRMAKETSELLKQFDALSNASKPVDYVSESVQAAVKELCQLLPKTFPSKADALCFAKGLPFIDAAAAAEKESAERRRKGEQANKVLADFWARVEKIGRLAGMDGDVVKRLIESSGY